jgi:hypothetical protein
MTPDDTIPPQQPPQARRLRIAITGHQPHLLGGFEGEAPGRLRALALEWVEERRPAEVVSGMAAGWDMAMAWAAVEAGVPLVAALAFPGQGRGWPDDALGELDWLLACCSLVHTVSEERTRDMWTARDRWVIDRGELVLALWSGATGGTGDAVAYATSLGKPIENLWERWQASIS